jgi:dTDP-4-amino-4,6-dideoxygalactose transaminase
VDIDKYEAFCAKHDKYLIFDNAATAHTFYKGKNSLNYGVGATISFHHTKPFGFGEGGAIIVDKKYEKSIRCLNNFGIGLTDRYWVSEGNNNKMSEIAAIYILQYLMDNKDTIVTRHTELTTHFMQSCATRGITHFRMFPSFHDKCVVPSCFCILFNNPDPFMVERLVEQGIQARKYYHPLDNSKLANETFRRILCLPCNIGMTGADIEMMLDVLAE